MKKLFRIAFVVIAFLAGLSSCGGGGPTPTPTPAFELTVNTTDDSGQGLCNNPGGSCSLREAINRANATAGTVMIRFNIPGSGLHMIRPNSALPAVTNTVIIDATTQPGYGGGIPLIEIEGSWTSNTSGLILRGAGSAVRGLMIVNFDRNGIDIRGPDVLIRQNYLGTDGGADVDMGNNGWGVDITCSADGSEMPLRAQIGDSNQGNLISGNGLGGVNIDFDPCHGRDSEAKVWGNIVGLDAAGDGLVGNGGPGVRIRHASQNEIGGLLHGRRNTISGNHGNGVEVLHVGSVKNTIHNNLIGTDLSGAQDRGNGQNGVYSEGNIVLIGGLELEAGNVIAASQEEGVLIALGPALIQGNRIGTNQAGTAALPNLNGVVVKSCNTNVQIGGSDSEARNIISGNTNAGILIRDSAACGDGDVKVFGNYIGTNPNGSQAIPNGIGVHVWANHTTVGGTATGLWNLVSGNLTHGILIESNDNIIKGNSIGDGLWQGGALPNGEAGILVKSGASGNTIETNTIHDNGTVGVQIVGGGTRNAVRKNAIYNNGGLGIDLGAEGVLANDNQDPDAGDNNLQNYPNLTSAEFDGTDAAIEGTLSAATGTAYTIDLYVSGECDPSGYGEGRRWVQSVAVTTNSNGQAAIQTVFPAAAIGAVGPVTATATDPDGNTSEFSNCIAMTEAPAATDTPDGMTFRASVDPAGIFWGRCDPSTVRISVEIVNPPEPISYVLLFVRLWDEKRGEKTEWGGGLSMLAAGKNIFFYDLSAYDVPGFNGFESAVLQYQFVAYNKAQEVIGRSDVYGDIAFKKCGAPAGAAG
ncbi:MAG: right-handed parallel beta-helix repeat-containing protein [Anaerolineales bacterium]